MSEREKNPTPLMLRLDRTCRLVLLKGVWFYQSRLGWLMGGHCRFVPTCSHYAEEALQRGPLLRALRLISWRLLRCQPLCKGGEDMVPPKKNGSRYILDEETIRRWRGE